jgi:hypothetical protein
MEIGVLREAETQLGGFSEEEDDFQAALEEEAMGEAA